jgi:WD40 repeat protein
MQIPTCFYWDPVTKTNCREDNKTNVYDLAFSPNGRYLAVSANVVVILDTETGQEVDRYWDRDHGTTDMFEVAFSPDGSTLAASGKSGRKRQVLVWDFPSAAQNPTVIPVDAQVEDLVFTPTNDLFLGSYKDKGLLGIFDLKTRRAIGQVSLGPKLYMSYSNDLSMFVVLSKKLDVDIWGIPPR